MAKTAKQLYEGIPQKFSKPSKSGYPRAKTVGELRKLLDELPESMPIDDESQHLIAMHCLPADIVTLMFDEE